MSKRIIRKSLVDYGIISCKRKYYCSETNKILRKNIDLMNKQIKEINKRIEKGEEGYRVIEISEKLEKIMDKDKIMPGSDNY